MSYGFNGFIGLAKETNWGSGAAVTDYIEALSEDVQTTLERFSHKAMIASLSEPDDSVGVRRVAGGVRFAAHPVAIGHFLKGALHSVDVTSLTSSFFRNVFVTTSGGSDFDSQVPHQPFTFEIFRDVTSSFRYTGCLIDTLTFNYGQGAVMCEATLIGRGSSVIQRTTPTFPSSSSKPYTFDTVSLGLAGAGTALIETLSVRINNNLQGIPALNISTDIAKVRRQNHQMIEVNGTIDFTNVTEYLNFINQTEQRMTISVTKAASFEMITDIPRLVYTSYPVATPGRERIVTQFVGKGFVHPGSLNAIKISMTSTRTH